jgi:LL-diaminopimelate aminotransferase
LPQLRKSISDWYYKRFGVELDHNKEVLPLIGAKEGIGHAALCFIDPGDVALIPDPGYPVYSIGTLFAGGQCHWMPLTEENNWLPDLNAIPNDVADQAKAIWLNYPNNPTGAIAGPEFFEEVVYFAKKHEIPVLHDAPYTEVAYEGYKPMSFFRNTRSKRCRCGIPLLIQEL